MKLWVRFIFPDFLTIGDGEIGQAGEAAHHLPVFGLNVEILDGHGYTFLNQRLSSPTILAWVARGKLVSTTI